MVAVASIPLAMVAAYLAFALASDADPAIEHYAAGLQFHQQGSFELAIEEFDQSIALNGGDALVYAKRGASYFALKKFNLALTDYGHAISMRSDLVPTLGSARFLTVKQALAESYMGRAMVYTVLGKDLYAQQSVGKAIDFGYGEGLAREKLDEIKGWR